MVITDLVTRVIVKEVLRIVVITDLVKRVIVKVLRIVVITDLVTRVIVKVLRIVVIIDLVKRVIVKVLTHCPAHLSPSTDSDCGLLYDCMCRDTDPSPEH